MTVRNSFLCSYFEPGISDLDISIFYTINNLSNQKLHIKFLYLCKKIFPFLAEVNFYDKQSITLVLMNNSIELLRDPLFSSFNKPITKIDKLFFILKKLDQSRHVLLYEFKNRYAKWIYYTEKSIGHYEFKNFQHFKSIIYSHIEKDISINYYDFYNFLHGDRLGSRLLWCINPFDAISTQTLPPPECDKHQPLIKQALLWELSGILTQYRTTKFDKQHLKRIEKVAQRCNQENIYYTVLEEINKFN